jgi:hypothetical protein
MSLNTNLIKMVRFNNFLLLGFISLMLYSCEDYGFLSGCNSRADTETVDLDSAAAELDSLAPVHTTLADLRGQRVVMPLNASGNINFLFEKNGDLYVVEFSPPKDSQIPIYNAESLKSYYSTEKGREGKILSEKGILESMGIKLKTSPRPEKPEEKEPEAERLKEFLKVGLKKGEIHRSVKVLQAYLNNKDCEVAEDGPGSLGQETPNFKDGTSSALAKYKRENRQEISTFGAFDPSGDNLDDATRRQINQEIYLDEKLKKQLGFM